MLFNYSGLSESIKKINKSLQGVTGSQYNAILSIATSTGSEAIIDPSTGNYVLEGATTQEFKAQLKKASAKPNQNLDIGTPFTRIELQGYFLDPLTTDLELPTSIPCQLLDDEKWITGTFYPVIDINSNINESFSIKISLGSKLKGVFEVQGNTNP